MSNVTWHDTFLQKEDYRRSHGHYSAVLWFTGLSGSGKSSIANAVSKLLHEKGIHASLLDGDNLRHGLNNDLGFSAEDRTENIRRTGEVAKLFVDHGLFCITAFISPYQEDRQRVRALLPQNEFIEVFVDAPLDVCEQRDPKGLYKKARAGQIPSFTGISAPYEAPEKAEIVINTALKSIEDSAKQIIAYLEDKGYIHSEKKAERSWEIQT
ncbi:adenylyl-sulfate kinase [Aureibacillus halotolerans]|uniref:Adenylyl-sulfate kinase n=1 Tax=Aureibacillus halotolerans TaxID=1508390 RepID=A0A4V6PWK5_9BACI|nr:adenylyl-sulfate kinase [Aureibacillus halotolerans]TDQ42727.1 adenylylsulfate kinase [Aureibacillus halotolerans]